MIGLNIRLKIADIFIDKSQTLNQYSNRIVVLQCWQLEWFIAVGFSLNCRKILNN